LDFPFVSIDWTTIMDNAHACANRCVSLFVDQLPAGLRETLYFIKDERRAPEFSHWELHHTERI
jgi:NifB/MoaA-like Fe-S oxidoreductase